MRVILVIGSILFLGGILFPLFKYFREIKKDNKVSSKHKNDSVGSKKEIEVDKDIIVNDSRDLLEFEEIIICNEEEAILKINDSEYVAYLEVSGVSYNLLSYEEKLSLEEAYGTLLNGIDFEFQNYIQSRSLNLDSYINKYSARISYLEEKLQKIKQKLETSEKEKERETYRADRDKLQNQLNYAYKLLNDFKRKYIESNLLERKYYIVLKYFHDETEFKDLSDIELLKTVYSNLYNKASIFIDTFQRMNMDCKMLDGIGIAELLYSSFNKDESSILKLESLIKSKYNHLCVTSTPVYIKDILKERANVEEEQKELEISIKEKVEKLSSINVGEEV